MTRSTEDILKDIHTMVGSARSGATSTPTPEPVVEEKEEEEVLSSAPVLEPEPWAVIDEENDIERGKFLFSELFWKPKYVADFLVTCYKGYESPAKAALYVPPTREFEMYALGGALGLKVNLVGPTGAGKDMMSEFYAASTGRPHLRIDHNQELDYASIFGATHITDGDTNFVPGVLIRMLDKPTVLTLSELTRAPSFANIIYQRFLDRREVALTMDKAAPETIFNVHPDLYICASDNTKGNGDGMDKYCASNVQDGAFINRWDMVLEVDYLTQAQEAKLINGMDHGMTKSEVESLARISNLLHAGFNKGELSVAFSPRNLSAIAKLTKAQLPLRAALQVNYVSRIPESEISDVEETLRAVLG